MRFSSQIFTRVDTREALLTQIPKFGIVLIVGPKLFIEPGTKAFFRLSSVSGPGL